MVKRGNHAATKVLVHWSGCDPKDATWEFLFNFQKKYSGYTLEDKSVAEGRY